MNHSPFTRSRTVDRILVVDDTPDNCLLIQAILQDEGYQVELADSGKEALRIIEQSPPDLVLLDVMMPGMDGYEVTRRIRANASLPFMPILLTTAYDQPSVAQGLDTGADDFIRKPVHFDELLALSRDDRKRQLMLNFYTPKIGQQINNLKILPNTEYAWLDPNFAKTPELKYELEELFEGWVLSKRLQRSP